MDDEVLRRRLVGVVSLALAAFLLSWLLPRPGLERLRTHGERVVTMDLTRADSMPEERGAERAIAAQADEPAGPVASQAQTEAAADESGAPPVPAPQAQREPAVAPKPEPKPEPASKPVAKPEPRVEPAAAPVSKPAPSGGVKVLVQAGAYSYRDKAEGVRAKAAEQGVSCAIASVDTATGTLYRVRCGPYADRGAADTAIRKLGGAGVTAQVVSAGR